MLDRTIAPPAMEIKTISLPEFQVQQFSNNTNCLIVDAGDQPVLMLELILQSGRWFEDKRGVSYFASKMMYQGIKGMSAQEIAMAFEEMGCHIEISPGYDHISIKLFSLKRFFEPSVRLLFKLFSQATFEPDEFDLMKSIRKQNIELLLDKPNQFASLKFTESLYGIHHPYGEILMPDMLDEISVEDAMDFYQYKLMASPKIIMAGQVNQQDIDLVKDLFKSVHISHSGLVEYELLEEKCDSIVDQKASQVSLRWGKPTIAKTHPDTHKLNITNAIFGGFFGSRLTKNIREKRGLTYGIHSSIVHMSNSSYWLIGSELLADKINEAVKEIVKEINVMANEVIIQQEFELARNYFRGKMLSSFDSPFSISDRYRSLFIFGLDKSFFDQYLHTLNTITLEEIRMIFQDYLSENLLKVMVK